MDTWIWIVIAAAVVLVVLLLVLAFRPARTAGGRTVIDREAASPPMGLALIRLRVE
jgi:hypothetical protein